MIIYDYINYMTFLYMIFTKLCAYKEGNLFDHGQFIILYPLINGRAILINILWKFFLTAKSSVGYSCCY